MCRQFQGQVLTRNQVCNLTAHGWVIQVWPSFSSFKEISEINCFQQDFRWRTSWHPCGCCVPGKVTHPSRTCQYVVCPTICWFTNTCWIFDFYSTFLEPNARILHANNVSKNLSWKFKNSGIFWIWFSPRVLTSYQKHSARHWIWHSSI
jgi:hypothetical protein